MSIHRFDYTVDRKVDPKPVQRIEVITGVERRRAWSPKEKRAILAESFEDGVVISEVARRHGLRPQSVSQVQAGPLAKRLRKQCRTVGFRTGDDRSCFPGGGNASGCPHNSRRLRTGTGRDRNCPRRRQLVSDWQLNNNPRESTAALDQQLTEFERVRRRAEDEANQRQCYEDMFLFGRSLKRTPACLRLDEEIETARRNISDLRHQRDAITNRANRRMRQDDLVAELARNGCGDNYAREHDTRRRSGSFLSLWEDESDDSFDRGYANTQPDQSNLPFASYRTMCVRLCDGYYFPISFSTLESRFKDDEIKCQEQCAAPAQLFIYRNPGEEVEQMVSLDGQPYTSLKTAFLNRKRYVKGCSCKPGEYSAAAIEQAGGKQASAKPAGNVSPERAEPASSGDSPENKASGRP